MGTEQRRSRRSGRAATRIGVLSDTHGLLRPEAVAALGGSDLIIHAGDVGDPAILSALRELAPVTAVRGNVDGHRWGESLPLAEVFDVDGVRVYVLHDLHQLDVDPVAAGLGVVVSGHSHRPLVERRDGILFLNPGSCGPRRFDLPVTVARLTVVGGSVEAVIVEVDVARPPSGPARHR